MNEAFAKIVVPFAQRTSARKAGTTYLNLPDGTKVIVMANLLAPDHDRSLFEPTLEFLSRYRPHVIIFAGRIIHAKVVKLLDPGISLALDEDEPPLAPEVQAALAHSQVLSASLNCFASSARASSSACCTQPVRNAALLSAGPGRRLGQESAAGRHHPR